MAPSRVLTVESRFHHSRGEQENRHMLKKSLVIASVATLMGAATLSTQAKAADPIFGALVGGALGAGIGHAVDGRHGAGVGAAIGAFAGAVSASSYDGYYGGSGYYGGGGYYGGPRAYGPAYAPAPVYGYGYAAPVYPSATIVYSSGGHRGHRHRHHRNHYRDGGYGY